MMKDCIGFVWYMGLIDFRFGNFVIVIGEVFF